MTIGNGGEEEMNSRVLVGVMGRIGSQTFVEHKGNSCFMLGRGLGGKSVGFVAAMVGHSPVTNLCTKSYSF